MTGRYTAMALALLTPLLLAPTPGDIGGCNDSRGTLDLSLFSADRQRLDCERCKECGVPTSRCARACGDLDPKYVVLPVTCVPIQHDGRVCLDALDNANCTDYARYVADVGAEAPAECVFCKGTP